jgi:hypothetical protein
VKDGRRIGRYRGGLGTWIYHAPGVRCRTRQQPVTDRRLRLHQRGLEELTHDGVRNETSSSPARAVRTRIRRRRARSIAAVRSAVLPLPVGASVTAVHEAANDANHATDPDPGWLPLLGTPPFPEHPSAHACAIASIVRTLRDFFGTNRTRFSTQSAISGTTRRFTRFSQAIDEVIEARVYAGIHFRAAGVQGARLGRKVALARAALLPTDAPTLMGMIRCIACPHHAGPSFSAPRR